MENWRQFVKLLAEGLISLGGIFFPPLLGACLQARIYLKFYPVLKKTLKKEHILAINKTF